MSRDLFGSAFVIGGIPVVLLSIDFAFAVSLDAQEIDGLAQERHLPP
jgi:hypothetical protein